ncbi:MAG: prepilin-type N-terminal cleavage/methylation domain-containing protein [Kiritimatiellia bacterium]|nr:prepilin-type N-terminal cleavage/methylation domain-containing protein [Kiritimatiellia bacterium]
MRKQSNHGFSLIEILVALIVVTVTVSVVLGSQLVSLKIEQKARALQFFRFETQRIFSATRRVKNEEELTRLLETNNLCRIKSEKVKIESGTNGVSLIKHELNTDPSAIASATAEDLPSFSSVFYTSIPDYSGQRSNAGQAPVKEQKSTLVP